MQGKLGTSARPQTSDVRAAPPIQTADRQCREMAGERRRHMSGVLPACPGLLPESRSSWPGVNRVLVRVECYAGHRGEETPRRLSFDGRSVQLLEVLDCWLGMDHRYFKMLGDDGATYILRHDTASQRWEMIMYQVSAAAKRRSSPC